MTIKTLRTKGSVKIHEDINFNIPIAEEILIKYLGNLQHPSAQTLLAAQFEQNIDLQVRKIIDICIIA